MNDLKQITQDKEYFSFSNATNFAHALKVAEVIAKSDLAPKDYRGKPENVLVAVQMGQDLGLKPMQAIQNIAVINGRPSLWGDAMLAIVQSHPAFEYIDEKISNGIATCTVKRKGMKEVTRTFSEADAKLADLLNKQGPWKQYKNRMLQMRARGFALRDSFADALKGIHMAEEAQDLPNERKEITNAEKVNNILQYETQTPPILESETIVETHHESKNEEPEHKESSYVPTALELLKQAIIDEKTPQENVDKWLKQCGVDSLDKLSEGQVKILTGKVYGEM